MPSPPPGMKAPEEHFTLCCWGGSHPGNEVTIPRPRTVLMESHSFDEAAFHIAVAPVVSEIVEADDPGQQNSELHGVEDHQESPGKVELSAEATVLAEYLLRELDLRLEAIDASIKDSISGLQECFAKKSVNGKASGILFSEIVEAHTVEPQKILENGNHISTHVDSMDVFQQPSTEENGVAGKASMEDDVHAAPTEIPKKKKQKKSNAEKASTWSVEKKSTWNVGRTSSAGMFAVKTEVKLDEIDYCVAQLYREDGWAQIIARSECFSNMSLMAIFLNAVYIGYDADNNPEENLLRADLQFLIIEHIFCAFFLWELIIRFCAFRRKLDCLKDTWFKFDATLATLMMLETWVLPVALGLPSGLVKLVRLLRVARMTRLIVLFPELIAMIKGVKVASRAVGSALLMLMSLVYIFAIVMFTLLKKEEDAIVHSRFRKLGVTMWTLLIDGVFLDGIGILSRAMMDANQYIATIVLLVFVLLSALTVLNMLIGVLCEVVSLVAAAEKEDIAIRMVKDNLLNLLRELDEDGSGELSREEILDVLKYSDAMVVLENLQVNTVHLIEHLDMFLEDEGALAIHKVLDMILMLRGDRPPMMKDLQHMQTFSRWKLDKHLQTIEDRLKVFQVSEERMFQA